MKQKMDVTIYGVVWGLGFGGRQKCLEGQALRFTVSDLERIMEKQMDEKTGNEMESVGM